MECKLRYNSREEGINDLIDKGVIDIENKYINGTDSVVYINLIVDKMQTLDDSGEVLIATTFLMGYHIDVMSEDTIDFKDKQVAPKQLKHKWI